ISCHGQMFVRFGHLLAKLCLDPRSARELLWATQHTHTISSQLAMVARVKGVTAESKASSELLLSNAQNLTQAVLHLLKAAEAASIKGLHQPPAGSEEAEVAAFCLTWRRTLWWHRAQEALNPTRDELGLRKTQARAEPSLAAMVQGEAP
ncbi:VINC protein, partial [Brachypteracias leptosomus]|nr:VINC protein [Brachypteracias leptosomus]